MFEFNFHITVIVILVYIFLYFSIIYFKPSFMYDEKNDCFRQFGVGYKNTTILPLWLISVLISIISYFLVLYVLHIRYNTIFIKN